MWFDILIVVDSSVWVSLGSGCKYNSNTWFQHTRHQFHFAILKATCTAVAGAPSHTFISQNISCNMIIFHYSIKCLIQTVSVRNKLSSVVRVEFSGYSQVLSCLLSLQTPSVLVYILHQQFSHEQDSQSATSWKKLCYLKALIKLSEFTRECEGCLKIKDLCLSFSFPILFFPFSHPFCLLLSLPLSTHSFFI